MYAVKIINSPLLTATATTTIANSAEDIAAAFLKAQQTIKEVSCVLPITGESAPVTRNSIINGVVQNEMARIKNAEYSAISVLYSELNNTKKEKTKQAVPIQKSIDDTQRLVVILLIERVIYLLQLQMGSIYLGVFDEQRNKDLLVKYINIFLNYIEESKVKFSKLEQKEITDFIDFAEKKTDLVNILSIRALIKQAKLLIRVLNKDSSSQVVSNLIASANKMTTLVSANVHLPPKISSKLNIDDKSKDSKKYFSEIVIVIQFVNRVLLEEPLSSKDRQEYKALVDDFKFICEGMLIESAQFMDFDEEENKQNPGENLFYAIYSHLKIDKILNKDATRAEMLEYVKSLISTGKYNDVNIHSRVIDLITKLMGIKATEENFKNLSFTFALPYYLAMYGGGPVYNIVECMMELYEQITRYNTYLENSLAFVDKWMDAVSDRYQVVKVLEAEKRNKLADNLISDLEKPIKKTRKRSGKNRPQHSDEDKNTSEVVELAVAQEMTLEPEIIEPVISESVTTEPVAVEAVVEEPEISAPVPNAFEALPKSIGEGIDSYKKALHLWKDAFESFERNKDISLTEQQKMFDFFRIFPKNPVRERFADRHQAVLEQIKMVADYYIPLVESAYAPTPEVSIPIDVIDLRDAESKISFIVNQISVCVKKYVEQAVNYEGLEGFFVSDAQYLLTALNAINRILEADCSGNLRKYAFEFSKNELFPYIPAIKSVARNAPGFIDKINDAESEFYRLGLSAPVATRNRVGPT